MIIIGKFHIYYLSIITNFCLLYIVPTPVVTAGGSSVTQLQMDATVQCNVSLSDVNLNDTFVTVMWLSPNQLLLTETFSAATTISDTRTINSSLNNAGEYSCLADLFFNGSNSQFVTDTSDEATAIVTITSELIIALTSKPAEFYYSVDDLPDQTTWYHLIDYNLYMYTCYTILYIHCI